MIRIYSLSLAGAVLISSIAQSVLAQEHTPDSNARVSGQWLMEVRQRKLVVEIASCGPVSLCGTIIRDVSETVDQTQRSPGKQDHPVGWKLLREFKPSDDGNWRGQMVNFMDGRQYKCTMRLESSGHLRVRPYVGLPAFGLTHLWPRYQQSRTTGQED
jgi:uncharacterized protein (DUF2147 family)